MRQELSEPEFYGDLMYKLKKIVGSTNLSAQFVKLIFHYKKIAIALMHCNRLHDWWSTQSQFANLVSSLIIAGGSDFRLYDGSNLKTYLLMRWKGPDALAVVRPIGVYLLDFFCSGILFYVMLSPYLCFISILYHANQTSMCLDPHLN